MANVRTQTSERLKIYPRASTKALRESIAAEKIARQKSIASEDDFNRIPTDDEWFRKCKPAKQSFAELSDQLEFQRKILKNVALLKRLPDGGAKIKARCAVLEDHIEQRQVRSSQQPAAPNPVSRFGQNLTVGLQVRETTTTYKTAPTYHRIVDERTTVASALNAVKPITTAAILPTPTPPPTTIAPSPATTTTTTQAAKAVATSTSTNPNTNSNTAMTDHVSISTSSNSDNNNNSNSINNDSNNNNNNNNNSNTTTTNNSRQPSNSTTDTNTNTNVETNANTNTSTNTNTTGKGETDTTTHTNTNTNTNVKLAAMDVDAALDDITDRIGFINLNDERGRNLFTKIRSATVKPRHPGGIMQISHAVAHQSYTDFVTRVQQYKIDMALTDFASAPTRTTTTREHKMQTTTPTSVTTATSATTSSSRSSSTATTRSPHDHGRDHDDGREDDNQRQRRHTSGLDLDIVTTDTAKLASHLLNENSDDSEEELDSDDYE